MDQSSYSLIQEAKNINKKQKEQSLQPQPVPVNEPENSIEESSCYNDEDENKPIIDQPEQRANFEKNEQWSPLKEQNAVVESQNVHLTTNIFGTVKKVKFSDSSQLQQEVYLRKSKYKMLIVFLCAAIHFGNQFTGNSPAPLQTEIQEWMEIEDSQFNVYFSIRSLSSILPPMVLMLFAGRKLSIKHQILFFTLCCLFGQLIFTIGLQNHSQSLCIWGRFFIGMSDTLTIFQQTIMCLWFPTSQLPYVFGLMLFAYKLVRTINDQFASVFYNEIGLLSYFWIGVWVSAFSVLAAVFLIQLHESVMQAENSLKQENKKEKQPKLQKTIRQECDALIEGMRRFQYKFWLLCLVDAFGYASVHAFYPNMSKFFREKFGYENTEAGVISSIPYAIASVSVPIIGARLRGQTDQFFLDCMILGLFCIFFVHFFYIFMPEGQGSAIVIAPVFVFGLGHAIFTTLIPTTTPKVLENPDQLEVAFCTQKLLEGIVITIFQQLSGSVRQTTGSYTWVSALLLSANTIALAGAFELANPGGGLYGNTTFYLNKVMSLCRAQPSQNEQKDCEIQQTIQPQKSQ